LPVLKAVVTTVALLCVACSIGGAMPSAKTTPRPSQSTPSLPAQAAFDRFYGSYRTKAGDTIVVTRLGWFADLADSTYRTLYSGPGPNRFIFGPGFRVPTPTAARLEFGDGSLTVRETGRTVTAQRVALNQTDVSIPADGATLAGTITEPAEPGPHAAIVVVHGSEPGERYYYDFWVGLYTSLGLTVLTYDKRGHGESSGRYPGEYASAEALTIYADDASAALSFLGSWRGVDSKRVGFHGGSQGGWTVPLAMARHGKAAFAVLVSAPAVTVGQQGIWSDFSSGGARMPSESAEQMNAAIRADHSGYDPAPALTALSAPALWILGRSDRTVPTDVCVENLNALQKPNLRIQLVTSGHGLLLNHTGLNADDDTAPGLAPGVINSISDWIKAVVR